MSQHLLIACHCESLHGSVKIIGKHVKLNCYTKIGEKEVSFEVPWKISYTNIKTFNDNSSGKINLSFLKNETNLQSNLIIPYDKINHKLIQIYMLIKTHLFY